MNKTIVVVLGVVSAHCTPARDSTDAEPPASGNDASGRRGAPRTDPGAPTTSPLPDGIPLTGEPGSDAYGRPLERPDSTALLALLQAKRIDRLDEAFAHYQSRFVAAATHEAWPVQAMKAFEVADPAMGPLLDAWVDDTEQPFAKACRGMWHYANAWKARGNDSIRNTPAANLEAMRPELARAKTDFAAAVTADPQFLAARMGLLYVARTEGDDKAQEQHFADGYAQCPACFVLWEEQMNASRPRWGGSAKQMQALTAIPRDVRKANPKLALLEAWPHYEVCLTVEDDDAALKACERASRVGTYPKVTCWTGHLLNHRKRYDEATRLLDDALRVDPQDRDCLSYRHFARGHLGDFTGSATDLLLARRLDPTNDDLDGNVKWMLDKLTSEAARARQAGDRTSSERLLALATQLSPGQVPPPSGDDTVSALKRQVDAAPDDFQLRRKLDHALLSGRQFDEILAMWDAFIDAHPDHAEAHAERSGTHWHAGDPKAAVRDMQRACDLGLQKACTDVPRMRAKAGL